MCSLDFIQTCAMIMKFFFFFFFFFFGGGVVNFVCVGGGGGGQSALPKNYYPHMYMYSLKFRS